MAHGVHYAFGFFRSFFIEFNLNVKFFGCVSVITSADTEAIRNERVSFSNHEYATLGHLRVSSPLVSRTTISTV